MKSWRFPGLRSPDLVWIPGLGRVDRDFGAGLSAFDVDVDGLVVDAVVVTAVAEALKQDVVHRRGHQNDVHLK